MDADVAGSRCIQAATLVRVVGYVVEFDEDGARWWRDGEVDFGGGDYEIFAGNRKTDWVLGEDERL